MCRLQKETFYSVTNICFLVWMKTIREFSFASILFLCHPLSFSICFYISRLVCHSYKYSLFISSPSTLNSFLFTTSWRTTRHEIYLEILEVYLHRMTCIFFFLLMYIRYEIQESIKVDDNWRRFVLDL